MKKILKLSFCAVFACAILGAGMPAAAGVETSTTATVPDLVGLSRAKALSQIMLSGMILGATTQVSSALVPTGDVILQAPTAGASVVPGTPVDIAVSAGPARFEVPDVVGLTQAEAQDKITAAELTPGRVTLNSSDNIPIGKVISQVPLAGTPLPQGGAVSLVVSSGPP